MLVVQPSQAFAGAPRATAGRIVKAEVTTRLKNTSDQPSHVELRIPLWSDAASSYQRLVSESFAPEPLEIQRDGDGRTAIYRLTVPPNTTVELVEQYTLALSAHHPAKRAAVTLAEVDRNAYLAPERGIEVHHPLIRDATNTAVETAVTVEQKAEAIFQFVRNHLRYDLNAAAAGQGALAGLTTGMGVCTEFAALFVAMARSAGIPSRIVNGYLLLDENNQLTASGPARLARHQWSEFWHPELGWVPVDPTWAGSIKESLPRASYVRQNFGDRPLQGTSRGGAITASRSVQITQVEDFELDASQGPIP